MVFGVKKGNKVTVISRRPSQIKQAWYHCGLCVSRIYKHTAMCTPPPADGNPFYVPRKVVYDASTDPPAAALPSECHAKWYAKENSPDVSPDAPPVPKNSTPLVLTQKKAKRQNEASR